MAAGTLAKLPIRPQRQGLWKKILDPDDSGDGQRLLIRPWRQGLWQRLPIKAQKTVAMPKNDLSGPGDRGNGKEHLLIPGESGDGNDLLGLTTMAIVATGK